MNNKNPEEATINLAKRSYILYKQIDSLENVAKIKDFEGFESLVRDYNKILAETKNIVEIDETFRNSLKHLKCYSYDNWNESDVKLVHDILADMAITKATLISFFDFYYPPEEKKKIGFTLEE
jgi:hypothetical protein